MWDISFLAILICSEVKPGNHEFPGEEYKFQKGICKWYVLDFHFDVKVIVAGIQGVFDQNASWISRHIYTKCFIFLCIKKLFLE